MKEKIIKAMGPMERGLAEIRANEIITLFNLHVIEKVRLKDTSLLNVIEEIYINI